MKNYTDKPIEERQAHIDLSTPCEFSKYKYRNKQTIQARQNLAELLDIPEPKGCQTHCCHLCLNHSNTDQVCVNPAHLYFGTARENHQDISPEVIAKATSKAGKVSANRAGHNSKVQVACPHCGFVTTKLAMGRHIKYCKHKVTKKIVQNSQVTYI